MLGGNNTGDWRQSETQLDGLRPSGLGLTSFSDIENIWQLSWRKTFYRGGPVLMSALSGIDIALWDLKGWLNPT